MSRTGFPVVNMISGLPGFILNGFSIIVLSAALVIVLTSIVLTTSLWQRLNLSALDRRRALWLVVLCPWLVGTMAMLIVVSLSQPEIATLFASELIHWHHLNDFHWNSWHGVLVLTAIALVVLMLMQVISRIATVGQTVELLSEFSRARPDGVLELDSDTPAAFTAGVRHPCCYMTRALIEALDNREYQVVRIHELSHVQSRDPARRAWFYVLAGLYPAVIAHFLMSQMITATEQLADAHVAVEVPDRAFIARVLLKAHRLLKRAVPAEQQSHVGICQFGVDSIEQRVSYLLSDRDSTSLSFIGTCAVLVSLSVACALGIDALHHAIELPWQH